MVTVEFAARAREFLRRETIYLRQFSPRAARNFVRSIEDARARLSRFPDMGFERQSPPVPGSRRLVVGSYVLDYHRAEKITITAIRHGRQRDPEAPPPEDDD